MRKSLIEKLVSEIKSRKSSDVIKIAIDGLMTSGKTTISSEIAGKLKSDGLDVIQVSVDDFFNSKEMRYAQGFESASGCYNDTIDIKGLTEYLLKPLSQRGNRKIKTAIFDSRLDKKIDSPWQQVNSESILIVEGLFLHRPELIGFWDLSIFLEVESDIALARAIERDIKFFNNEEELTNKHSVRYDPAQRLYLHEVQPQLKADIIVKNNDLNNPIISVN